MQKRIVFLLLLALMVLALAAGAYLTRQNLMLSLITGIQNLSSCGSCLSFLIPLQMLARMGDDAFTEALVDVCVGMDIQEEDICQGALTSQAPIIAHALRSISLSQRTATLFCSEILGLCPYPPVPHYNWPLVKPERNATVPLSGQKPTIKFVHVSDVHMDREYLPGSEARCNRPICCRASSSSDEGPIVSPAGKFGNYNCDTPTVLFDSMMKAINEYAGDAEALLFTGDVVDHAVWLSTQDIVTDSVEKMYASMLQSLPMPVYGAIGNHDVHPTNAFARSGGSSSQWALDLHERVWEPYIGHQEAHRSATHQSGSYSILHPKTNLRIISYNSNFAYKANFWLYDSDRWEPDSNGLFSWLAGELQGAETRGERVWIVSHMAPGAGDYMQDSSAVFDQIVQRYRKTISASFYGHTHRAEFQIGYSTYADRNEHTATSINYIAPALTPSSGNPSFRIYEVDPDSFAIMDYVEIISNLQAPDYQTEPKWVPYYSARESYGGLLFDRPLAAHEPLDGPFWHRVTEVFEQNNWAFNMFMQRLNRGAHRVHCWSAQCKESWINTLRTARSEYARTAVRPHQPWRKRALHTHGEDEHEEDPNKSGCSGRAEDARALLKGLAAGVNATTIQGFLDQHAERRRQSTWKDWLTRRV